MFDFQQLVADLSEEKLLPSVPVKGNQVELLKLSDRAIKSVQSRQIYPKELGGPLGCQLELTHKCNLRCKQCYNQSGNPKPDLSIKKWLDVAKQLVDIGTFECVISGGEPLLLGDDLYKIMDVLHDGGMRFVLVTNGMLMNEKVMDKISKYDYYWIQVSIDGSRPEIHDEIRGVKGSWNKAVDAAKMVSQAGLPLVVSHVIQKDNVDYLDEMIETSYLLGAKRMITGRFTYTGRAVVNKNDIDIDKNRLKQIFNLLKLRHDQYTGKMEIITSTDPVFFLRYRILEPCNVLLIRPNGDVKLDCILPFKIGNMMNDNLSDIWKIAKNAWKNEKVLKYVGSLKEESDMLKVHPIPYVDEDVLIR